MECDRSRSCCAFASHHPHQLTLPGYAALSVWKMCEETLAKAPTLLPPLVFVMKPPASCCVSKQRVMSTAERRAAAAAHHLQHEENVLRRDYGRSAVAMSSAFVFMNTICHDASCTSVCTRFRPQKQLVASGGEAASPPMWARIRFQGLGNLQGFVSFSFTSHYQY